MGSAQQSHQLYNKLHHAHRNLLRHKKGIGFSGTNEIIFM